ncbi:Delta and Notch-like epidermal growth factor-related receptor [Strongyloides ratti]|uniref:Delta and Notch-like epidermal growth factor-related receptor n=1 Tax=Strongyloides ratti TaxID=34506 RepID=A0A090LSE6_STRRB|nr:Delta and Notch-like epidermal growth factor-related receptor [Strongyloides ratti]CEF71132.1 Delta and Notch-like epidermal growth factor-related receptor [Strongyloides ratti]
MESNLFNSFLLTTTETSIIQSLFNNIQQHNDNEFWNNWQLLNDDLNLTAKIGNKNLTLNKSSFEWFSNLDVKAKNINLKDNKKYVKNKSLCISVKKNNLLKENIEYNVNECLDKKSFICETFSCFKDEFRCKNNSKCLPQIFLCNGYPDCPDNSDEIDCVCSSNTTIIYDNKQKNGYITSPINKKLNKGTEKCNWEINQDKNENIMLKFITVHLQDNEVISISQPNNEIFFLTNKNITNLDDTWKFNSNKLSITYYRNLLNPGYLNIFYKTMNDNNDVTYLNNNNGIINFYKVGFIINETLQHKWFINNNENEIKTFTITNILYDSKTFFSIKLGSNFINQSFFLQDTFLPTSLISLEEPLEIEISTKGKRNTTIIFEGFYENSCLSIIHNITNFGQIFSPNYHQMLSSKNISINCSWIIKPPCSKTPNGCYISIIPYIKNFINGSYVIISGLKDNFLLDNLISFQKIYRFHLSPNNNEIMIKIRSNTSNFKVKFIYSIDCYLPNELNGLLIENILQTSNIKNRNIYPITSNLIFKCSNKKILTPKTSTSVECLIGGKWSSKIPKCIELLCPLPYIENGYINSIDGYTISSKLVYGCNIGYISSNKNYTAYCNEKQIFYPIPICKKVKCSSSTNSITYNVLDVKKNICPDGFKITNGSDKSQCNLDGKWNYNNYQCDEIKCYQEVIENSLLTKPRLYKFNDTLQLDCIYGYEKNFNKNIICNEYGEWIDEDGEIFNNIKCIKKINNNNLINCDSIGGCKNDGICIYENNMLKCQCKDGYYGLNCQLQSLNCNSNKNKRCLMDKEFLPLYDYNNKCSTCMDKHLIGDNNLCKNNPCQNDGKCKLINNKNYYCKYKDGLNGKKCEQSYDICKIVGGDKSYCNNHGKCIIKNNKPFCECMLLWKGKHCETPVNICEKNKNYCLNGGSCLSIIGSLFPICKCSKMFYGDRCEKKIDYCQFKPCFHDGICSNNEISGYSCLCNSSYMGKGCYIDKEVCTNDPCQNNGICISKNDSSYTCICSNQYTGPNCSQFINLCLEYENKGISYCMNGGVCHSLRGENIICECNDNYDGDKCQNKIEKNKNNYNLFFTPTKFYDFDYYSQYNKSNEIKETNTNEQLIFSPVFRSSFLNETTICGWIKPSINEKEDISFIVVGTYNGNRIKKSIIDFTLKGVILNYDKKKITINYNLIPNIWQHLCLRSPKLRKYQTTSWDLFYNGLLFKSANQGIEPLKIKERYLRILLGESLNYKSKYQGEMTLVEYYSNLLSDKEILNLATKCSYNGSRPPIVGWSDYTDSSKSNGYVVKIEPGLCSENDNNNIINNNFNILRDDTNNIPSYLLNIDYSVTVKNCPKDIYKYTDTDGAIVEWKPNKGEEIFKNFSDLSNFYVNFNSGGYFKLGSYKVMYIGTNKYNINGICQFSIHVLKNDN